MRVIPSLALCVAAVGCDTGSMMTAVDGVPSAVRVINAFTGPVDVLIDGNVAATLSAGAIDTLKPSGGSHTFALRPSGVSASTSAPITMPLSTLSTIAAVRSATGAVSGAVLDDTNSVVPAGATKLRIIHLAPNAGTLQVYRTQPDFQTPISWQFPFDYQPDPTSLSAPFLQSTVGTWEVHIWQTPADASGWSTAPVQLQLPLASGEKRTILMLDKAGGGVRVEVI